MGPQDSEFSQLFGMRKSQLQSQLTKLYSKCTETLVSSRWIVIPTFSCFGVSILDD